MGGSLSQHRKGSVSSPRKKSSISDSEGTFGTPEAESPGVEKLLRQLDNSNHTAPADITNHFQDKNSNQDVSAVSSRDVDSLNNLTCPSLGDSGFDQNLNLNLNLTLGSGEGLSPLRPPSLAVLSSLNKPDPSEVDDQAPLTSHSNLIPGQDPCVDADFLNGNTNSDSALSSCKKSCETNGAIITNSCKVKQIQPMQKDISEKDEHRGDHATDEEKLASSVCVKADKEDSIQDPHVTSKPEGSDCRSVRYEEPCKMMNKSGGSEVGKTGSQVLDSICISEAEKQAVLTLIREEIITKEVEANDWKTKCESGRQEVAEMRKIVAEYEKTIAQMIEDEQRSNRSAQKALLAVTAEKEAAIGDLNSVERSLSDLFRRYENLKSTLEGFKKNEEVLKKCAQDYLARIKQEEQRYQTLKLHAEEKLDKANEDIAQVRSKSSSENIALTASLRKEQMKNESMEQALQQKNQEIEELTKICDELIAKMGRVD